MRIDVRARGEVDIVDVAVEPAGDADGRALHERLERLLATGRSSFVLNLARGPVLDSAWLGELVLCREHVRKRDGTLKLVLTRPQARAVAAGNLESLFETFRNEDEALDSFVPWYATDGIP